IFSSYSGPGISDFKAAVGAAPLYFIRGSQAYSSGFSEFNSVAKQVQQDLFQPERIGMHICIWMDAAAEFQFDVFFRCLRANNGNDFIQEAADVENCSFEF